MNLSNQLMFTTISVSLQLLQKDNFSVYTQYQTVISVSMSLYDWLGYFTKNNWVHCKVS